MATASQQPGQTYDAGFYAAQVEGSLHSARVVVPLVLDMVSDVRSVVDIGCGTGAWLSVFKGMGVSKVQGVDGGSVPESHFLIERDEFRSHSLTEPLDLGEKFSLAMSLEVAEHLEEEYAAQFVALLCGASDVVLFGAAIPGQGGHNHVNERWPSYWCALFADQGYRVVDTIRPVIWGDTRVEWWYRQNTFLFVREGCENRLAMDVPVVSLPTDLVHPECFIQFQDARLRSAREKGQFTADWLVQSVNEEHRLKCDGWLEDLMGAGVRSVALFCAGGNGGLGPYLVLRCRDLGIEVCAYVEYLAGCSLDIPFEVPVADKGAIAAFAGKAQGFLVASPAFAGPIIEMITEQLGTGHPPLYGMVPRP
ncbi:MAG: hypothetical protein EP335_01445 [Alphaproteobacteria bacterium]|nr:MAG: hypothetical protein EP335_01445 [Alphaproteobacteria bacterium]